MPDGANQHKRTPRGLVIAGASLTLLFVIITVARLLTGTKAFSTESGEVPLLLVTWACAAAWALTPYLWAFKRSELNITRTVILMILVQVCLYASTFLLIYGRTSAIAGAEAVVITPFVQWAIILVATFMRRLQYGRSDSREIPSN